MSTPLILTGVARSAIEDVLTGPQFSGLVAAGFVGIWWLSLQVMEIDRVDFLMASVIAPAIMFLGIVAIKAVLWQLLNFVPGWPEQHRELWAYLWNIFDFVSSTFATLFVYVGVFTVAGFIAVWLARQVPLNDRFGSPAAERG